MEGPHMPLLGFRLPGDWCTSLPVCGVIPAPELYTACPDLMISGIICYLEGVVNLFLMRGCLPWEVSLYISKGVYSELSWPLT